MDGKRNRKTLNIEDFQIGDLVLIADGRAIIEEPSFGKRTYGIIVPDRRNSVNGIFPQIAVYVFHKEYVEFHWPSYLQIVSSTAA